MKNEKINTAAIQHNITQKSQAIYRHAIKQPASQFKPLVRKIGRNMDIARSKSIAHFAPHPVSSPIQPNSAKKQFDIAPTRHPLVTKVEKKQLVNNAIKTPQPVIDQSPKAIKEQMIAMAFNQLTESQKQEKADQRHKSRIFNIIAVIIVLLAIAAYFIFVNLPSISVGVASAQAGIKASYPEYRPDGYSLDGSVSYSDGQVTINFHANTGNKKFAITQSRSSWDSSAVKDKVNKDSKGMFVTTEENGLTIYTYNGNAAWVNGGILYTITGDAPLSNSQIRHIATSL